MYRLPNGRDGWSTSKLAPGDKIDRSINYDDVKKVYTGQDEAPLRTHDWKDLPLRRVAFVPIQGAADNPQKVVDDIPGEEAKDKELNVRNPVTTQPT